MDRYHEKIELERYSEELQEELSELNAEIEKAEDNPAISDNEINRLREKAARIDREIDDTEARISELEIIDECETERWARHVN